MSIEINEKKNENVLFQNLQYVNFGFDLCQIYPIG